MEKLLHHHSPLTSIDLLLLQSLISTHPLQLLPTFYLCLVLCGLILFQVLPPNVSKSCQIHRKQPAEFNNFDLYMFLLLILFQLKVILPFVVISCYILLHGQKVALEEDLQLFL